MNDLILDSWYGDPVLTATRQAAQAGDWAAVQTAMSATYGNWELRGQYAQVLSDVALKESRWLDEWLRARPDAPPRCFSAASPS